MKFIVVIAGLLTINILPQWNTGAVKLGYFNPSATDGGFIIGFEGGKHFDKYMSWTWSVDWFNRNYVDKELVDELNQYYPRAFGETNELRASTNIHDFPVMFGISARFPIFKRAQFFASGSVGAELLIINYR
ncbi:MAG: hypothetical protein EHM44_03780, partial [Ignavibacteriales bacterium]